MMMKTDLKRPCKNCPFGIAETRIRFACRERAEEIEEYAYRQGFPCHLSAHVDDDDEEGGHVAAADGSTQHCAGAIGTFINGGYDAWPGVDNDDDLVERLANQIDLSACFESPEAFFEANDS